MNLHSVLTTYAWISTTLWSEIFSTLEKDLEMPIITFFFLIHSLGMFRSAAQLGRRNAKRAVPAVHSTTFTFHSRRPQCQVSFTCHPPTELDRVFYFCRFSFAILQGFVLQTDRRVYCSSRFT